MKKKLTANKDGIVYSTDPNFSLEDEHRPGESILPAEQKLTVRLDTKQRAGKSVTLIDGFVGKDAELEDLGKKLKNYCGTGGSVKDGQVIIQGDQREKVMQWLMKNGFKKARKL